MIDRAGFADFLRHRRDLLRPADVGLPAGVRRRTSGLRREEVALLAGISTDYYSRMEQSRGPHPSEPIVAALARTLRCDLDERDHLYHLAGLTPPARRADRHVSPGLIKLADRLTDIPVCICTDLNEVLWQNALADLVMGAQTRPAGRDRNITWLWFTEPGTRTRFPEEDWAQVSAAHVSDLRAINSRRAGETDAVSLVHDLSTSSSEFRDLWALHEVSVRRSAGKRFVHPELGLLQLTCEVLLTPHEDVKMLALFPTEGTDAQDKLDLLRVIGTHEFQRVT